MGYLGHKHTTYDHDRSRKLAVVLNDIRSNYKARFRSDFMLSVLELLTND